MKWEKINEYAKSFVAYLIGYMILNIWNPEEPYYTITWALLLALSWAMIPWNKQ